MQTDQTTPPVSPIKIFKLIPMITAVYDSLDDDWHFANVPLDINGWPVDGCVTFSNTELGFPYCKNGKRINQITPLMAINALNKWRKNLE